MAWEYSDTDCKYANVCSSSPRCTTKNRRGCQYYEKKEKRTMLQKIFCPINYEKLLIEFNNKTNRR